MNATLARLCINGIPAVVMNNEHGTSKSTARMPLIHILSSPLRGGQRGAFDNAKTMGKGEKG